MLEVHGNRMHLWRIPRGPVLRQGRAAQAFKDDQDSDAEAGSPFNQVTRTRS